jgi:hypothetical protein
MKSATTYCNRYIILLAANSRKFVSRLVPSAKLVGSRPFGGLSTYYG